MGVSLRFPRGTMKPPFGATINPDHPLAHKHLMSVLFHGQGLVVDVGAPDTGPMIYANHHTAGAFDTDIPPRVHLSGGVSPSFHSNREGSCLRCVDGNKLSLCDSRIFSTTQVTLCVIRRKTDATLRNAALFSSGATGATAIIAQVPWSDGGAYFRFGGDTAPNLLSVAGLSFSTTIPERWVFTAGPRGSSMWQNGVKVGSQSTAITRTASTDNFVLNGSDIGGIGTDLQDWNFFMALDTQWSDDMCRWWSAEPYVHLYSEVNTRRYFFLGNPSSAAYRPWFSYGSEVIGAQHL